MKAIVTVPASKDSRKKSWAKIIKSVNREISTGYAFEGDFLRRNEKCELEIGTLIMLYDATGSMKNWKPEVEVLRVSGDGLESVYAYQGGYNEKSWALGCRDAIANLLDEATEINPLAEFSIEQLQAEIQRRQSAILSYTDLVSK